MPASQGVIPGELRTFRLVFRTRNGVQMAVGTRAWPAIGKRLPGRKPLTGQLRGIQVPLSRSPRTVTHEGGRRPAPVKRRAGRRWRWAWHLPRPPIAHICRASGLAPPRPGDRQPLFRRHPTKAPASAGSPGRALIFCADAKPQIYSPGRPGTGSWPKSTGSPASVDAQLTPGSYATRRTPKIKKRLPGPPGPPAPDHGRAVLAER